jgi:hypothetical protein
VLEPIANAKSQGKEAFANGDYGNAVDCYTGISLNQNMSCTCWGDTKCCTTIAIYLGLMNIIMLRRHE